jgi:hypothetical protein
LVRHAVADLLKTFIRETLLHDLSRSGLGSPAGAEDHEVRQLADGWILDTELQTGEPVPHAVHGAANRFVAKQWKGLLERFRGDRHAAHVTLLNLLDAEFPVSQQHTEW